MEDLRYELPAETLEARWEMLRTQNARYIHVIQIDIISVLVSVIFCHSFHVFSREGLDRRVW